MASMAQSMASTAGLRGSNRLPRARSTRFPVARPSFAVVNAQQQQPMEGEVDGQSSRRTVLGLAAGGLASGTFVQAVLAAAKSIKVGPPPPPSGGLPGTLNSDEPRDLDLPYKDRFYLQPLSPTEAAKRAKESAKDILGVKDWIDKKAWPYIQNDLRLKAEYLRYDIKTVIAAKPKEEKKPLAELTQKVFSKIDNLDHAAKIKSTQEAEKSYSETASAINDLLAKLG